MKANAKHWLFNLKRKIEYFFYPERNRLSLQSRLNRRVANFIKMYFECPTEFRDSYPIYNLGITKVTVKVRKANMNVTVELTRPGLLIGKAGREIDGLKERLSNHFDTIVIINIVESWLF